MNTSEHHAHHNHGRALFYVQQHAPVLCWRPVAPMQGMLHNTTCLRNGWSAKTLRRISASINLITSQELSYAINMFGMCFDRKGCKDLSGVNRTLFTTGTGQNLRQIDSFKNQNDRDCLGSQGLVSRFNQGTETFESAISIFSTEN